MLIASGDGFCAFIIVVAKSIAAPRMCITPNTRCAGKNRSAIIPTKKGEIIPAIGPTVKSAEVCGGEADCAKVIRPRHVPRAPDEELDEHHQ